MRSVFDNNIITLEEKFIIFLCVPCYHKLFIIEAWIGKAQLELKETSICKQYCLIILSDISSGKSDKFILRIFFFYAPHTKAK